jgi:hypothetical protein
VRSATIKAIAAGTPQISRGRSATKPNAARATALFTNMSAMGEGYSQCRESYFACMDQFCGLKSDTYRRCLCSNKFREFKDREDAFDEAKQLITQFNDNNLYAIDKTAAEVDAMYSATVGEAAMKKDTSAAAKALENINNLLSGKQKASSKSSNVAKNMGTGSGGGTLNLDFGSIGGDIWSDSPSDGNPFSVTLGGNNRSTAVDVESLEGNELYNGVHKQCAEVSTSCSQNQAQGNMVYSAYTVLISQDCTAYEKKLDAQKAALESTIREANKMLRDARLDDFRAHNSADVNACMDNVIAGIKVPNACGSNWERCLDFTGQYVNPTTGEAIPTPKLFDLKNIMKLEAANAFSPDGPNADFIAGLEKKKVFVTSALDSCRSIADTVWDAFRQSALIEIAQAQDAKIESVKSSCIATMKECYDTQTGAMKDLGAVKDDEEMSSAVQSTTAALGQRAAKTMCAERVATCASLYCPPNKTCVECKWGGDGKITNASDCGAASLIAFVDAVDDTKITMYCKRDLESYIMQLCTPGGDVGKASNSAASNSQPSVEEISNSTETNGPAKLCNDIPDEKGNVDGKCSPEEKARYQELMGAIDNAEIERSFPYKCRTMPKYGKGSVYEKLIERAKIVCMNPETKQFDPTGSAAINDIMANVSSSMTTLLQRKCTILDGGTGESFWVDDWTPTTPSNPKKILAVSPQYATEVFNSNEGFAATISQNVNIQFGGGGNGAITMSGTAVAMPTPSPALDDVANYLAAKSWGACEVGTAKEQCELMNALVNGGDLAVYDPVSRQCEFKDGYYKAVCQNFLAISGAPSTAVWDAQKKECRIMPK